MQIGDKVLVPRTGGGESAGEVIEIYTKHARVRFPIGDTFKGRKLPGTLETTYGYKTLRQSDLKLIKEVTR